MRRTGLNTLAVAATIAVACGSTPPAPAVKPSTPDVRSALGPFTLVIPRDWVAKPFTSKMRAADYTVGSDAEVIVYYFGESGAGSVEANVERWVGQFTSSPEAAKIEHVKLAGQDATIVSVSGHYAAGAMPGSEAVDIPDAAMLAAIVASPSGPYYWRLVGARATVVANETKFRAMLASLALGPAVAAAPAPAPAPPAAAPANGPISPTVVAAAKQALLAKYPSAKDEIERGVDQVAKFWRTSDGDLAELCVAQFAPDAAARDALFARLEAMMEQIDGHVQELDRAAKWGSEVENGKPPLPVDGVLAAYAFGAHVTEDLFTTKVAFSILLNFPLTSLSDRLADGAKYDRRRWAEVRLTRRVDRRIPGNLAAAASAAEASGDQYVASYNIWMHHVLDDQGQRRFPSGKRLISHWNLRDELKANYTDKDGLAKQRTIVKIMERIVTQTIPAAVIDNPRLDWNPFSNAVTAAPAGEIEADAPKDRATSPSDVREPDTRFEHVLEHFRAARAIDPYSPTAPTYIDRAFDSAEIPEAQVRQILTDILDSPLAADVAKEIQAKVNRPLEPEDLWYPLAEKGAPETELDKLTRKKYPTADAFAADIPRILRDLGFSPARAKYLAEHIAVDPSRGAGHAMEERRRGDKAHLRTRVEAGGMDYKGYNIAVHELGHNIEQVFSLYDIDHTLLAGVPNVAFTEALAFLFQARDLELLGRPRPKGSSERARVLDTFWATREIAGSALVEIDVWHWLYDHPNATATELRDATVRIARGVWDRYYAPLLGGKGIALLGIYSHSIASPLYLFNYVLGHTIAFQVEEHVAGKDKATFAKEFERIARQGDILPDLWMQGATGKPVGAKPLLDATARALSAR